MDTIDKNSIELKWHPLKRVGPFSFGSPIDEHIAKYGLVHVPEEYNEKVNWEVYELGNLVRIYSELGEIAAISCPTICEFNDLNLIGITVEEAIKIFGMKPDSVETEELSEAPQEVYDFDDLGIQLWVKDNKIVTAICSGPCDK